MLFVKFLILLGIGLAGLCMALKTVMDILLTDWDALGVLGRRYRTFGVRTRSLLGSSLEDESTGARARPVLSTRLGGRSDE